MEDDYLDYEVGEDLSAGGTRLSDPGCYHMIVTEIRVPGANKDGKPIPNSRFTVACAVGDGTVPNRKGKTVDLNFFEPSLSAKDGGAFQRKKSDRFLLSIGLLKEADLGKQVRVPIKQAVGRQFCVKLEAAKDKQGKETGYLDISFADIFHVDDPEVATWPKDTAMLAHIPRSQRKVATPNSSAPPKQPAAVADKLEL
jgi:hypothetical protein